MKKIEKGLSVWFNCALFLLFCFGAGINYLFSPESTNTVPWDVIYTWNPVIGIGGAVGMALLFLVVSPVLGKYFWNNLVVHVFDVKEITYNDSLALILMYLLLTL